MRLYFHALPLSVAALFLAACDPAISPAKMQQGDRIAEASDALFAAYANEDAEAAAAVYAPDAVMRTPAGVFEGPEAIRADYQGLFDDPNSALSSTRSDVIVASAGDYGVTEGTYSVSYTMNGEPQTQTGAYLMVWRRQDDDSWKIIRDYAMADPQAPAP